jgi:ATP-dependent HslUV protease ATP-binding subunit HslU
MSELTPKGIVQELDKYVVGQQDAKRSVAIALRNRWRRKHVPQDMQEEIYPHNILMVGPTGVGKTEIARRLAKLVNAPFIKVEATKFTEVGYVGRDVDSIIRDLVEYGIKMMREKMRKEVVEKATTAAEARVIVALVGEKSSDETKKKFYDKFKRGTLDDHEVEINIQEAPAGGVPMFDIPGMPGGQMGLLNIGEMLGKSLGGPKMKLAKLKVKDAYEAVLKEESDKLVDEERMIKEAIHLVENDGIVFLDEIDKIASRSETRGDVSREGVQRDLLPLLEGSTVSTKYGIVKTDHILFIASGAFHLAKPSDLLPELQGRLPIRVELNALTEEDLVKILKEPKHSLIKQYKALFEVEKVTLDFVDSGIKEIARIATNINKEVENIGARRLHTILEKLLEGINFTASDTPDAIIKIDKKYVETHLADITKKQDLSKFIL